MELLEKSCKACNKNTKVLSDAESGQLLRQLCGWSIRENKHLSKSYKTGDFAKSLSMANEIGALAEAQGHHPDLLVTWGKLTVTLSTHIVGGLTENDFILAAKIDRLPPP
jgi:4a-hydroxytetrahydrobiopterin dehydratase